VAGATDDCVQGISFQLCTGLRVIDPFVTRMGWKNAAGDAVTYTNSRGLVFSGCTDITVHSARSSFMGQGIDHTGNLGSGNADIVHFNPNVSDTAFYGIKAANLTRALPIALTGRALLKPSPTLTPTNTLIAWPSTAAMASAPTAGSPRPDRQYTTCQSGISAALPTKDAARR
jgi:hypothetical protein